MAQSNQIVLVGEMGRKKVSKKSVESVFTASAWQYFWVMVGCGLLSIIPFVMPFALCMKERWVARHTRIVGMTLQFEGTGGKLLKKMFLWGIIFIITAGIAMPGLVGAYHKWVVEHTIFGPEAM